MSNMPCSPPLRSSLHVTLWLRKIQSVTEYIGALTVHPWRHSYKILLTTLQDPDRHLDLWIQAQQSTYSFVGLVASVISAVVAQLLNVPQTTQSTWVAPAALYFSLCLSLMAVVTGLVMSEFLTAARFQPSRAAQLKFLFGVDSEDERRGYHAWIGAMLYSTPDVLLSQTIMGAFVGTGIVVVGPLWDRQDGEWDGAHKIACVGIVGLSIGTAAYILSILVLYRLKG